MFKEAFLASWMEDIFIHAKRGPFSAISHLSVAFFLIEGYLNLHEKIFSSSEVAAWGRSHKDPFTTSGKSCIFPNCSVDDLVTNSKLFPDSNVHWNLFHNKQILAYMILDTSSASKYMIAGYKHSAWSSAQYSTLLYSLIQQAHILFVQKQSILYTECLPWLIEVTVPYLALAQSLTGEQ